MEMKSLLLYLKVEQDKKSSCYDVASEMRVLSRGHKSNKVTCNTKGAICWGKCVSRDFSPSSEALALRSPVSGKHNLQDHFSGIAYSSNLCKISLNLEFNSLCFC